MTSPYADTWSHFDLMLGLTADLLPVVNDPAIEISPNSKMKSKGKTPSIVNGAGCAAGIPDWTTRQTTGREIDRWSVDPRLGLCVQTRHVRAIDIDIGDRGLADRIEAFVVERLGALPCRMRANSGKRLLALIVEGDVHKRQFKGEHGLVELLGTGQQFVACGPHYDSKTGQPSGADYEWRGGLPDVLPTVVKSAIDDTLAALAAAFGLEELGRGAERRRGERLDVDDPVANWLYDAGLVLDDASDRLYVECPWKDGHSGDSGVTEAAWLIAGSNAYEQGHFKCLHASCSQRTDDDFLHVVGYTAADFEELGELPPPPACDGPSRLAAIPADDFALRPPPRWIVKNILPEAQLGMVFGASGAGKSFFVLDLVSAIALGQPWRGNRTRQLGVVYVCAEGAGGFRNRVAAYRQQNDVSFGSSLHVIAGQPDFLGAGDAVTIAEETLRVGAGLVVIDTLAQVTPGGDENSAVDMGKALKKCRQISELTGAMVLLVHHAGKDAARGARGWSGIRAAADMEIEVSLHNSGVRVARLTKQKDGGDGIGFGFTLESVAIGMDEDGDTIESCVIEACDVPVDDEAPQRPSEPKGKVQKVVWQVFQSLVETDGGAELADVIEGAVDALGGPVRWRTRESVNRALVNLSTADEDGFAWLFGSGSRVFAGEEV